MPRRTIINNPSTTADQTSICEVLDRVLAKGVVAQGNLTISVANIPLIQLSLAALLASVETFAEEQHTQ